MSSSCEIPEQRKGFEGVSHYTEPQRKALHTMGNLEHCLKIYIYYFF